MGDPLVAKAKEAIDAVFTDTSVKPEETRERLQELAEEIGMMLETLPR